MPTLHLRAVPPELLARLRAGARTRDLPIDAYALDVLTSGLDAREARARGGRGSLTSLTAEERSQRARKAVAAREAKRPAHE